MSGADLLADMLLKVTDAMTESRTFPVNLLGPVLYEVGAWTIDKLDILESACPIVVTTQKRRRAQIQNVFDLARDMARRGANGTPPTPLAPVRHLHRV